MAVNTTVDNQAVLRLMREIAKDRARLSQEIAELALDDTPEAKSSGKTGRLSRVFALRSA